MALKPFGSTKWHILRSKAGEAHTAEQISFQPPAGMSATNVQDALNEILTILAAGASGLSAAGFYRHIQSTPSATWTINHELGFRPSVQVIDADGDDIDASIEHLDADTSVVSFITPIAGEAFLS